MANAFFLGLLYFLAVFTFAFATGAIRELTVAPLIGSSAAVVLEVPFLVLASWIVALRLLRKRSLTVTERIAMGATAFTLTIVCEAALAAVMRRQSISDWMASVATPLGLVGLAAQVVFAAMPVFLAHNRSDIAPNN